jgi:protease-4
MEQTNKPGIIRRCLSALGKLITWLRIILVNGVFLLTLLLMVVLFSSTELPSIPDRGALILNPQGKVVDQLSFTDPFKNLMGESNPEERETLLQDMIDAIVLAKDDERITSMVMELDYLAHAGISKMQELAAALAQFRASGKKIVAVGDHFSQDQYWLAAQADEVYMHPMGAVFIQGYGLYRNYFKSALEKLQINFHVFRVGEYKSALEPFIRQDMSPEAKLANRVWLQALWQQYQQTVAERRGIAAEDVQNYVDKIDQLLEKYHGNTATVAAAVGLIDGVKSRDQMRQYLIETVGVKDENGDYEGVGFEHYLWVRNYENHEQVFDKQVGLIVAKGMIVDGEQPAGTIGGDSLAALVRQAREDASVNAVVLRIDSGGGSAFASEVIRRELQLLKEAGKPLVVSMGSMAASGGYWIASVADEIWATPATITGSIGIFGAFPTVEKTIESLGISNDGVGTTKLAGGMRIDRPLSPIAQRAIQHSIEHGYRQFLETVAEGRAMPVVDVEKVAEGRVWSGVDARQLGLVDQLGGMAEAVASAASLAELGDNYGTLLIEPVLSPRELLIKQLMGDVMAQTGLNSAIAAWVQPMLDSARLLGQLNDPKGVYLYCSVCVAP